MFLDPSRPPVLTESAAMTLSGVLESTLRLIEQGAALITDVPTAAARSTPWWAPF